MENENPFVTEPNNSSDKSPTLSEPRPQSEPNTACIGVVSTASDFLKSGESRNFHTTNMSKTSNFAYSAPDPNNKIGLDALAKRLLEENFILTALEFYTELLESGKECKRLRDFFSNPANFEIHSTGYSASAPNKFEISPTSGLARTSSAQTLDSLDFCHYSDDGRQSDEKIAVLEFELRKANETIKALREQLTVATESALTSASMDTIHAYESSPHESSTTTMMNHRPRKFSMEKSDSLLFKPQIQLHEKKALNFLINEYLLQNGYKLTGVCFSEEVGDQDFEDWDEIGLNIARPSDLLSLYRQFSQNFSINSTPTHSITINNSNINKRDFECNVDLDNERNPFMQDIVESESLLAKLKSENDELTRRNEFLDGEIKRLNFDMDRLHQTISNVRLKTAEDKQQLSAETDENSSGDISTLSKMQISSSQSESKRLAPTAFKDLLCKLLLNKQHSSSIDNDRVLRDVTYIASTPEDLVQSLCQILPNVIPNVLLNKRNDFIPLMLSISALHPDMKERDKSLSNFFRLYKKPDDDQRQLLVAACVAYVRHVGPIRAESELLPQCWEQINDKYTERRLLVAEICGALAPFLPAELLSSLLLSMLRQMLTDDKSEQVKEAVVKSLSIVCNYIEDCDKFSQVYDLMLKSVTDSSDQVSTAARTYLIPALSIWANEIDRLHFMLTGFTKLINQIVTTSGVSQSANQNLLCAYFGSLRSMTNTLFASVLYSAPFRNNKECPSTAPNSPNREITQSATDFLKHRLPITDQPLDDLSSLFASRQELMQLITQFDHVTGQEWYQTWDSLEFVYKEFLPQLISSLCKLDCTLNKLPLICVRYVYHAAKIFGRAFSTSKMKQLFVHAIGDFSNFNYFSYCIIPVYAAGVLGSYSTESDKKELKLFLKTCILKIAEHNGTTISLFVTFEALTTLYPDQDLLLSVIWDLITYQSPLVRKLCSQILCKLVRCLSADSQIKAKLLSGLITLASDPDLQVRISTLSGFCGFVETGVFSEEFSEKVRMQLASFFEDTHSDSQRIETTVCLIRTFAQSTPILEPSFRDEFLIPQLAVVAARNNLCPSTEHKQSICAALFEIYSALSCCYLSPVAIADSFLPGLKSLLKDLDADRAKVANSIARDLESKVLLPSSQVMRKSSASMTTEAVDVVKSRMFNTFRDFKDKMEQHKDTVPKLFGKK